MGKYKWRLLNYSALMILSLVYLFDVDGAQLGLKFWPDISPLVVDVTSVIGNTIWLLGVFFAIGGIGMIWMMAEEGIAKADEVIKKTLANNIDSLEQLAHRSIGAKILLTVGIVMHVIGVGSGFWFTASAALLLTVGGILFTNKIMVRAKELLKDDETEAPLNISKNPLDHP